MGYLVALGLLAVFSAALLHRYGRGLLLTMGAVLTVLVAAGVLIEANAERQTAARNAALQSGAAP